jgi:hypothetical protein
LLLHLLLLLLPDLRPLLLLLLLADLPLLLLPLLPNPQSSCPRVSLQPLHRPHHQTQTPPRHLHQWQPQKAPLLALLWLELLGGNAQGWVLVHS